MLRAATLLLFSYSLRVVVDEKRFVSLLRLGVPKGSDYMYLDSFHTQLLHTEAMNCCDKL